MRRDFVIRGVCILSLVAAAYVLSYAPYVRLRVAQSKSEVEASFAGYAEPFYEPVYYLHDATPARSLLGSWALLWGVDGEVQYASERRVFSREIFDADELR